MSDKLVGVMCFEKQQQKSTRVLLYFDQEDSNNDNYYYLDLPDGMPKEEVAEALRDLANLIHH